MTLSESKKSIKAEKAKKAKIDVETTNVPEFEQFTAMILDQGEQCHRFCDLVHVSLVCFYLRVLSR